MTQFNKILVVLDVYNDFRDDFRGDDFSDNLGHLPLEIRKASEFIGNREQARIYLVGCGFEEFLHDSYSNFGPDAIEQRKKFIAGMKGRLDAVGESLSGKGYQVDSRVHWTYPRYEQITREALDLDVDIVVQHAHRRLPHEKHNLSHDSWQLIKSCPKPLLLTKDKHWGPEPVILAAVDPVHSHHKPLGLDFKILDTALQTQKRLGGDLHIVHAFTGAARPFVQTDTLRDTHARALDDLLADYHLPASSVHLLDKTPMDAIMHCQGALQTDITVIGALSRSRLAEMIIGNTASRVLDYLSSDLLIIRPDGVRAS